MLFRTGGLLLLGGYLFVYFGKMLAQHRRGIRTDQLASGGKPDAVRRKELLVKLFVIAASVAQVLCSLFAPPVFPAPVRIIGFLLGALGVALFTVAAWTMHDSWRAGIPTEDRTELITTGIYSRSRNPAYLGLYLLHLGLLLLFFHPLLLFFSGWAVALIHQQILNEEDFLARRFGEPYRIYCSQVGRYWG